MKKTTVHLKFPSQFSKFINHADKIEFEGETFNDFLNSIETIYGNIKERLLDTDGQLHPYLNIFLGKKNIKSLNGMNSIICEGECVSLLLSRAGG